MYKCFTAVHRIRLFIYNHMIISKIGRARWGERERIDSVRQEKEKEREKKCIIFN